MRDANIGTHHRSAHAAPSSPRRDAMYASSRRRRRAERGEVSFVGAASTTAETDRSYSRRTSRGGFAQEVQRTTNMRRILLVILLVVAIVAVGSFVAVRAFFGIADGKIGLADKGVASKLVASTADKPYYTLITADLDESNNCDTDVDMVLVARMDEKNKQLSLLSVPVQLKSTFADGNVHMISEAVYYGGLTQLISSVSGLLDQDISHVVTLDEPGIKNLVDVNGGLDWDVTEEIDDPYAGSIYIPAGSQKLNGDQVVTLLRATNFTEGIQTQGANQGMFVAKMLQLYASASKFDAASKVDKVAGSFGTDWSSDGLTNVLTAFNGFASNSAFASSIPAIKTTVGRNAPSSIDSSMFKPMLEAFKNGSDPARALQADKVVVDPAGVTVTVKNGAGITGGAASLASTLTNAGYKVEDVGNTDSPVYTETLVIYLSDNKKDAATAIANMLGTARVVDGAGRYSFETDIQVVLGSDWMPEQ